MKITVEISYYPLMGNYAEPLEELIDKVTENKKVRIKPETMSSLLSGAYEDVMDLKNTP